MMRSVPFPVSVQCFEARTLTGFYLPAADCGVIDPLIDICMVYLGWLTGNFIGCLLLSFELVFCRQSSRAFLNFNHAFFFG